MEKSLGSRQENSKASFVLISMIISMLLLASFFLALEMQFIPSEYHTESIYSFSSICVYGWRTGWEHKQKRGKKDREMFDFTFRNVPVMHWAIRKQSF